MAYNTVSRGLRFLHLTASNGFYGYALPVRVRPQTQFTMAGLCPLFVNFDGGAHGRIVSISRGSPPPKTR